MDVRLCIDERDVGVYKRVNTLAGVKASISLRRPDVTPLLPKLTVPTLFITGAEHADWSPDQARTASQLLPRGSVKVLEESAYLGPLEAPEEFTRLMREYWAIHAPSKPDFS